MDSRSAKEWFELAKSDIEAAQFLLKCDQNLMKLLPIIVSKRQRST